MDRTVHVAPTSTSSTVSRRCGGGKIAGLIPVVIGVVGLIQGSTSADDASLRWVPAPGAAPRIRATQPVAPVAPEPAVFAPAAPALPAPAHVHSGIDDLAVRTGQMEHERKWSDIVRLCEPAVRTGSLAPQLLQRYDVARIHCDIARRYNETSFRSRIVGLSEAEARRLHTDLLARIASHYVDEPDFARLSVRGRLAIDVAIDDPVFLASLPRPVGDADRAAYRSQIADMASQVRVTNRQEAERFAAWTAHIASATLGIPPAVTLVELSAAAMGGLDEYSAFLTSGQLDDLYSQIEGNFVGLGVELKEADDGLLIVHVIPGSPAERSGVRAGDHLVGIAGKAIAGMGVDSAAQLLQGPEGSLVTLAVLRGPAPPRAITVRREHVEVPSIENARLVDPDAGVGYLKITSFQKSTASDLDRAMQRLDAGGMRSLVVDLRGNPGGLLSAGVDAADLFLERGLVVATRGRSPEEDFNYAAGRPGTWRMPLVVLIDGDSASASEIFAGAIRDHRRGTIVGQRSYGKGSVQGIFPLDIAGVGIRLTTAKFYSPNGHPYSRVGVEPDVQVHSTMRVDPAAPSAGEPGDVCLDTAVQVARRSQPRPAAKPPARGTASR